MGSQRVGHDRATELNFNNVYLLAMVNKQANKKQRQNKTQEQKNLTGAPGVCHAELLVWRISQEYQSLLLLAGHSLKYSTFLLSKKVLHQKKWKWHGRKSEANSNRLLRTYWELLPWSQGPQYQISKFTWNVVGSWVTSWRGGDKKPLCLEAHCIQGYWISSSLFI